MLLTLALALLAGTVSTLSPCVLPLIPILVATALRYGRAAPLALAAGLVVSFAVVGTALSAAGAAAATSESLRVAGAFLLVLFGVVLLVPRLQRLASAVLQPLAALAEPWLSALPGNGLGGQFLVGAVLGIVWSPCTGPTLGAAVSLAAAGGTLLAALTTMAVYGMGAAAPLLLVAYAGRVGGKRLGLARHLGAIATPIVGVALLAAGLLVITGVDRTIQAALTARMPAWLIDLTTSY